MVICNENVVLLFGIKTTDNCNNGLIQDVAGIIGLATMSEGLD